MIAIENKIGNGKSVEFINGVAARMDDNVKMLMAFDDLAEANNVSVEVFNAAITSARNNISAATMLINGVADGSIDDGDVMDYINETGDNIMERAEISIFGSRHFINRISTEWS